MSSKRLTMKDNNSLSSSDDENEKEEVESEYCIEDILEEEESL